MQTDNSQKPLRRNIPVIYLAGNVSMRVFALLAVAVLLSTPAHAGFQVLGVGPDTSCSTYSGLWKTYGHKSTFLYSDPDSVVQVGIVDWLLDLYTRLNVAAPEGKEAGVPDANAYLGAVDRYRSTHPEVDILDAGLQAYFKLLRSDSGSGS
jgi:hypothetical protein